MGGLMEVGIRQLRGHLSEYLDRVRAGEEVTVTDRGVAIAVIAPLGERRLDRLVKEGLVQPATATARHRPRQRRHSKGLVSELVADQRA
jgi:prevent-host-death family protein